MSRLANQVGRRFVRSRKLTSKATLRRQSEGMRNERGRWIPGTTTEHNIRLATVPYRYKGIRGEGVKSITVPEGVREADVRYFYVIDSDEINTVIPGESTGDVIIYDGTEYRVVGVLGWAGYSEVVGVKLEALPGG